MIKQILSSLILITLFGCNNTNFNSSTATGDTAVTAVIGSTPTLALVNAITPSKADSIEKINGNQIALDSKSDLLKATVLKEDSLIDLIANMRLDHRIFGYEMPDIASKRMLLLSIFTSDVVGNPFSCPLGAYYQTNNMDGASIKYITTEGAFVKANFIKAGRIQATIYIEKNWIDFEK